MFKYEVFYKESMSTVILFGDVDIDVTEIIEENIAPDLMNSKDIEIEIDFENVSFVDSSGIGLLITLVTNLKECGKKVVFTHLQTDVKQVFSLLQLPEILGQDVFVDFHETVK